MKLDKREIAAVLSTMAELLELKGENPFKIRAYENAARIIERLSNFEELVSENKLMTVNGIGAHLSDHITLLYNTGKFKEFEYLLRSIPKGILEILKIPGVGAKKAKVFWKKLGIESVSDLEKACEKNRIRDLEGFGQKSQDKIAESIKEMKKHQGRALFPYAFEAAVRILDALKNSKTIVRGEIAGSLRRKMETVKDIDLLVSSARPEKVMEIFVSHPLVGSVIQKGPTKSAVIFKTGINADLRCVADREFPYALHHFTGSREHNTAMRGRAKKMSFKMNEYGLFRGEKNIPCKDEAEIFSRLGLQYIPPELREDMGEITAAENNKLPRLIELKDIKGILHVHTNYSDGSNTISEMAEAVRGLGYKYLGICDHSESASYAGGMKRADVKKQHKEIDALNRKMKGFKILKGIEADILHDGAIDYGDEILATFDFVVASVHSRFSMSEEEMTARVIKALTNPYVDILGHPTGRLLLAREPYKIDMKRVIEAAAKYKKIIELNANPQRLDIDWRLGPFVKKCGVKIAICPDAHDIAGLDDMKYGIGIARKAWLEKGDVVIDPPLRIRGGGRGYEYSNSPRPPLILRGGECTRE